MNNTFYWDVEYGERIVDLKDFCVSKYMVTNNEYYEFIKDNGYNIHSYWIDDNNDDEGWKWRVLYNINNPITWIIPDEIEYK